jgi:hypothetical protein
MMVNNNHNATITSHNTTPPSPLCDITNTSSTQGSSATTQVPLISAQATFTAVTTRLRNKRLVNTKYLVLIIIYFIR